MAASTDQGDQDQASGKRFGQALAYLFALGMLSVLVVWIVAKMTRTDQADYLVTRIGLALGLCLLVAIAAVLSRRHGRRRG